MRLPYVVSSNARVVYETSMTMSNCVDERDRTLVAEDFEWDRLHMPAPLTECCCIALSRIFHRIRPLDLILQKDVNLLMDLYPPDIPLKFSVPFIKDEQYWKRSFASKWPEKLELGVNNWKEKFLSVYLQEYLENASADVFIEEDAVTLATLVSPYIFSLSLWQLQIVRPPVPPMPSEGVVEDTCPFSVAPCVDHIPLENIYKKLYNLIEVSLVFGVNNLSDRYNSRYFDFSMADCHSLCKGLVELQFIQIFRINRSKLDCARLKLILQYLVKKVTIVELDFSHCMIGDHGVKAAAGFMHIHGGLRILRLANNKFGDVGIQGLAYALQMKPAAPIEILGPISTSKLLEKIHM